MRIPFFRPSARGPREAAEYTALRRRVMLALMALVGVSVLGVVGFSVIGGSEYGVVDAIYMTVITLTTVGFGEVIDMSANPAGRVFTVALLMGGMGIVAYTVPMVAQFALEGQLNHIVSRRRMRKTIAQLTGHYIVCGDSETALHVVEELVRTGRDTVLVVPTEELRDEAFYRAAAAYTIVAEPTDDPTLADAGIERAAGVVFCLESDKDNVLGVLGARGVAAQVRIIAGTERRDTHRKLVAAGADAVVNPGQIGGLRMASELVRPKVVSFLDTMLRDDQSLRVEEIRVPAGATPQSLSALELDDVEGALVLAVSDPESGGFVFKPASDTVVKPGSTVVVMADPDGRRRLEEQVRTRTGSGSAR